MSFTGHTAGFLDLPRVIALLIALSACVTDVRSRRIPNVLTFGSAAAALAFGLASGGFQGLGWAAAGWAVGAVLFFPLFALGGLGAGDVKLLAALGAWLGPGLAVWVALLAALAGGPLAVAVALSRGYARQALGNLWGLLTYWRVLGLRPHPGLTLESAPSTTPRLPYALPIAAGLMVTLWLH
jgi:prepilin peptidase CpaA